MVESMTYSMADMRSNEQQAEERPTLGELRTIARDIETLLRKSLDGHQREISLDIGISESKLSRAKTGDGGLNVSDIALLFAALHWRGVHVISTDAGVVCMPTEKASALTYLAREALAK
jgi:hypothetical protein